MWYDKVFQKNIFAIGFFFFFLGKSLHKQSARPEEEEGLYKSNRDPWIWQSRSPSGQASYQYLQLDLKGIYG